jgi:CO/xanthine dehydrogenase Mo-binding subunit
VVLRTGWVEPAYLEPDASWCAPGGEPASPLANGGAFGGKRASAAPLAARALADRLGRTVRVVLAREDVTRLGPKRPPVALRAVLQDGSLVVDGVVAGPVRDDDLVAPYADLDVSMRLASTRLPGPPTTRDLRASVVAELRVAAEGALDAAGFDRSAHLVSERDAEVLLANAVALPGRGRAGARVLIDDATGGIEHVEVRVAAGDPLDATVLRSYAIGAAHMALGWVLTEGIAVDPGTGAVEDLTIRSFGILRPKATPPIDVTIVDDPGPPLPAATDAVFVAVAAAAWGAVARAEGERPDTFPARGTRAARMLRR